MICIINENCKFRATGSKNKHTLAAKQFIYYVQTLYTVYYSFFFFCLCHSKAADYCNSGKWFGLK